MKSVNLSVALLVPVLTLAGCSGGDPDSSASPSESATLSGTNQLYDDFLAEVRATPIEEVATVCQALDLDLLGNSIVETAATLKESFGAEGRAEAVAESTKYGVDEDDIYLALARAYHDVCSE